MAHRSPARFLAPLALLAALVAVGYVVSKTSGDDATTTAAPKTATNAVTGKGGSKTTPARTTTATTGTTTSAAPGEKKTYRVAAGDTLGSIAERTGVTVAQLQELNPGLDPQSLTVGQSIRLRR